MQLCEEKDQDDFPVVHMPHYTSTYHPIVPLMILPVPTYTLTLQKGRLYKMHSVGCFEKPVSADKTSPCRHGASISIILLCLRMKYLIPRLVLTQPFPFCNLALVQQVLLSINLIFQ